MRCRVQPLDPRPDAVALCSGCTSGIMESLDNKLRSVKCHRSIVMPIRRTDVKLTRLRIGHTRFTHRHLLFGS
ncbi:hypothetical protein TNCV_382671 [Trichonephila clavipes]|nr:hypothetical protein TNCV_382671 [Trichonephila clavipes]